MSKAIYQPKGKAREYSAWACNLYNGCPNACYYCYNNKGITKSKVGGTNVRLKKCLVDEKTALSIFKEELDRYKGSIIHDGYLHFNFVSDPCLPETIELNWSCIDYALSKGVPCQVLTKRADWLEHPAVQNALSHPKLLIGFSLTGCDDLEPGASTNEERIKAMSFLHDIEVKTWASIEPIIDPEKSLDMIAKTIECCDLYRIGILSGIKNYTPYDIRCFMSRVYMLGSIPVFWKNSLIDFIRKKTIWEMTLP